MEEKYVNLNEFAKNGQYKCPNCGASDITFNEKKGKLVCNYCGCEFEEKVTRQDIKNIKGTVRGTGTTDIVENSEDIITLKCGGCGAEVVIDTKSSGSARCHWCRSILSINDKIDNGSVPDMLLPFKTTKNEAQTKINEYVKKHTFYANPIFKKEFTTENIMGVYFPYMLIDANTHCKFIGTSEKKIKQYEIDDKTYYDSDEYSVEREFDMTVKGLTIESNKERLDKNSEEKTNNIINAIMPFDTENCVKYTANYLINYTSEKRDVNVNDLEEKSNKQLNTIARYKMIEDMKEYDRGTHWDTEDIKTLGKQWMSAYLPVWLYSYQEIKGDKKILHYVAVNARTNETIGSIPINNKLLLLVSTILEIIGIILGIFLFMVTSTGDDDDSNYLFFVLFALGFVYYGFIYAKYRNKDARHTFEKETNTEISNLIKKDNKIKTIKKQRSPKIENENASRIEE